MFKASEVNKKAKAAQNKIPDDIVEKLDKLMLEVYHRFADNTCIFIDLEQIDPELYDGIYLHSIGNTEVFWIDKDTYVEQYFKNYEYYVQAGNFEYSKYGGSESTGFLISIHPINEYNEFCIDTYTPQNKRDI